MIKVGLTGGIGSGKSLAASIFEHLNVPVYHADIEARRILESAEVKDLLIKTFGNGILDPNGNPDRKALADIVFSDRVQIARLNEIIHPRVRSDFEIWLTDKSEYPYIIMEAAILFESGFDKLFEKIIVVDAPIDICIQRVVARDHSDFEKVKARMNNQMQPDQKVTMADYLIINDGKRMILPSILLIHKSLLDLS